MESDTGTGLLLLQWYCKHKGRNENMEHNLILELYKTENKSMNPHEMN